MKVTIKTLAENLNLSTATVSRVLNSRKTEFISDKTREAVMATAHELGYRPNQTARALATGRTNTIGLLAFAIYPVHYSQILNYMGKLIAKDNLNLQIIETFNQLPGQTKLMNISSWAVDGIIAFDSPVCVKALSEFKSKPHVPIVSMGTAIAEGVDSVEVDSYEGTVEGIRHLAARGGRRVAFLGYPKAEDTQDPRVRAYLKVMKESGLDLEFIHVYSEDITLYRDVARSVIKGYVRSHGCPNAIFACTDEIAIGGIRGLQDMGIRIPREVAVLGFDGIQETAFHNPSVSTVEMPMLEVCRQAWELLHKRMNTPSGPVENIILKSKLVIRESSGIELR